jgi:hypothetical protein
MAANKAIFSHMTAFKVFLRCKNKPTSQYFLLHNAGPEKENNDL